METTYLERLGLTKGEIKVYLSLLRLGDSTITPLVKDSQVTKSKVYDLLDKLINKGLVGSINKEKKRYYRASDPIKIKEIIERKEKQLEKDKEEIEKMLPMLRQEQQKVIPQQKAMYYEGIEGYKTIRGELIQELNARDNLLVIGAPALANKKFDAWLLEFHKKRETKKIGMKIIYDENAKQFALLRTKLKLTQVRYFEKNIMTPSWIEIFKSSILVGVISEDYLYSFIIKDSNVVSSFKIYFELLWQTAKK